MMSFNPAHYLVFTMACVAWSTVAHAGEVRCTHCGCDTACAKICRLICEEKKVEIVCFGCKCEDFCIPGPSRASCKHCEAVCDVCDKNDPKSPVTRPKRLVWTEWIPGCATVHTRKKLTRRTVSNTIPSYKWVVDVLCNGCEGKIEPVVIDPGATIPPPPVVDARILMPVKSR
jgi:hypothetical protein